MDAYTLRALLEESPVIAAVTEERFKAAVQSPAAVLFHLHANLLHISAQIDEAHKAGKCILVHLGSPAFTISCKTPVPISWRSCRASSARCLPPLRKPTFP